MGKSAVIVQPREIMIDTDLVGKTWFYVEKLSRLG